MPLNELLRSATVRVQALSDPYPSAGTGVFITPDLALTCMHVMKNGSDICDAAVLDCFSEDPRAQVRFVLEVFEPSLDLALLRVKDGEQEKLPRHAWAPVKPFSSEADALSPEDELLAIGFRGGGDQAEDIRFRYEGQKEHAETTETVKLVKLRFGEAVPGMSGAALIAPRTFYLDAVLGITRDANSSLGALAVPVREWKKLGERIQGVQPYPAWDDLVQEPKRRLRNAIATLLLAFVVNLWVLRYANGWKVSLPLGLVGFTAGCIPWVADGAREWLKGVLGRAGTTRYVAILCVMFIAAACFSGRAKIDFGPQAKPDQKAFVCPSGTKPSDCISDRFALRAGSFPRLVGKYDVGINGCRLTSGTLYPFGTLPVSDQFVPRSGVTLLIPCQEYRNSYNHPSRITLKIDGQDRTIDFCSRAMWLGEACGVRLPAGVEKLIKSVNKDGAHLNWETALLTRESPESWSPAASCRNDTEQTSDWQHPIPTTTVDGIDVLWVGCPEAPRD